MSTPKPATGHIALVERQRGAVWYARVRIGGADGRQVVKKLGPAWTDKRRRKPDGYVSKADAEQRLREMLVDADRGTLAVAAKKSGVTFADAAAEFLRFIRDDREREISTVSGYRGVIDGYLLARFGEVDITEITPAHIRAYRDDLKAQTKPDGTRRLGNRVIVRHLVVLNAIFKRAISVWEHVTFNPAGAEVVDRPPVKYSNAYRTLTPDQIRYAASKMDIEVESALILTAAFSGLRIGELLALRWRDLHFASQSIIVERSLGCAIRQLDGTFARYEKLPKSDKVRSSVLVDEVLIVLDALSRREHFTEPDDLVFCNDVGEYLSDGMLRRRWYAALDQAGLPRHRIHDLRHAFATLAVQAFPDLTHVQGLLGHAHISTTMRYVHARPRTDDAARMQSVLGSGGQLSNQLSNPAHPRESPITPIS